MQDNTINIKFGSTPLTWIFWLSSGLLEASKKKRHQQLPTLPNPQFCQYPKTRALYLGKQFSLPKPSIFPQFAILYEALIWLNKNERKLVFISIQGPLWFFSRSSSPIHLQAPHLLTKSEFKIESTKVRTHPMLKPNQYQTIKPTHISC